MSIGVEHEDKRQAKTNPKWVTPVMLQTSAILVAELMVKYKVPIENVLGHNTPWIQKLNPNYAHSDPERYWPWEEYRKLIKEELDKIK